MSKRNTWLSCDMVATEKEAKERCEQNPNMWETIVALMDNDIREQVHAELAPCTEEEFYNRYCELHEQKYGIAFIVN